MVSCDDESFRGLGGGGGAEFRMAMVRPVVGVRSLENDCNDIGFKGRDGGLCLGIEVEVAARFIPGVGSSLKSTSLRVVERLASAPKVLVDRV